MFKLITLSDSAYFDAGKLFFQTRNVIKDEDIILYGPDLDKNQRKVLSSHNIEYKHINKRDFQTQMQFLKFEMCLEQIDLDHQKKYAGFILSDLDVFFVNNWKHIYDYDFDLAIIVRPDYIKRKIMRSYGCGGGFHFKHGVQGLFKYAREVILNGGDKTLPEYDRIWKTLESGRPDHKTHYRNVYRWWVDQIFMSSIVLRFLESKKYVVTFGMEPMFTDFRGFKIAFLSTKYYNVLDSRPIIKKEENIYIRHLKHSGRQKLLGTKNVIVKEKL
jgi:hypothetical protein